LNDRRALLRFLAASPVLALAGCSSRVAELAAAPVVTTTAAALQEENAAVIRSVKEALNVFDFDAAARTKLSGAHYTFITDGSFNNETLLANRAGFTRYGVRLRRLTATSKVDQSVRLFGTTWSSPIFFCPVGRMNAFHAEGALTVARAAKSTGTLQILSGSSAILKDPRSLDDVNAARGEPVWFAGQGDALTEPVLRRLDAAGCSTIVWTVDDAGANTIGARSIQRAGVADLDRLGDARCNGCHTAQRPVNRVAAAAPMDTMGAVGALLSAGSLTRSWDDLRRLRDLTRSKRLLLKGIVTQEDAALAVRHGVDGVIVSNHGGHEDASGRGAIDCLPEVVAAVKGRIPVLIDSGFRSGADVFKALALGATAVGIGRPHIWGLASFGQEGVETVVALLRRELQVMMAQTGAASIAAIRRDMLVADQR
jgi:4-hydroxymandelate oxidase